jgi:hypothetical protein
MPYRYVQIMSPRTDLCNTCQHFRNGLQYNARKEEEAKDLLKKYKEHLVNTGKMQKIQPLNSV